MRDNFENAPRVEELYAVNVTITLLAILLFVVVGAHVLPRSLHLAGADSPTSQSSVAFLLNISLIIFAWRRSVDFKKASVARGVAERRAHQLAHKDDVTGLFNRRHLMERLEEANSSPARALTLLFIDIDHFKPVNDLYESDSKLFDLIS